MYSVIDHPLTQVAYITVGRPKLRGLHLLLCVPQNNTRCKFKPRKYHRIFHMSL